MNCWRARKLLSAYLDGELSASQSQEVRAHLSGCDGCRQRLAQYRKINDACATLARQMPTVDVVRQVRAQIVNGSAPRPWQPSWTSPVFDTLLCPAYVKVPIALALVATVVLGGYFAVRTAFPPQGGHSGTELVSQKADQPRLSEASKSPTTPQVSRAILKDGRMIIPTSNPEEAIRLTKALTLHFQGEMLQFNVGTVTTIRIQLPKRQLAELQRHLLVAYGAMDTDTPQEQRQRILALVNDLKRMLNNAASLTLPSSSIQFLPVALEGVSPTRVNIFSASKAIPLQDFTGLPFTLSAESLAPLLQRQAQPMSGSADKDIIEVEIRPEPPER